MPSMIYMHWRKIESAARQIKLNMFLLSNNQKLNHEDNAPLSLDKFPENSWVI